MVEKDGYVLSPIDCGLPSQTSACQAGIMYGDNYDIPAFRWYDKDQGKLFVSHHAADAAAIDARFSSGRGLLRGGSSIGNLTSGDAEKSLLTFSTLNTRDEETNRLRADDLRLFFINPYLFPRCRADLVGHSRRVATGPAPETAQRAAAHQPPGKGLPDHSRRDERPAARHLHLRGLARRDPRRAGDLPYLAYDEVAHHAGPDTRDAFMTLRQLDGQIRRVRDMIARKAGRPYDLFVLSDHGQSFGATFRQRYGYELKDFIEKHLAHGATIAHTHGHDVGASFTGALVEELKNMNEQGVTGRVGRATVGRAQTALQRRVDAHVPAAPAAMDADVLVFASGNLANVYFSLRRGKISIDELNAAHPSLVDALAEHEGVGFVVGYDGEGAGRARKSRRAQSAHGRDHRRRSLMRYGDVDLRATNCYGWRVPHAGDLIVNSTVYAERTMNGNITVAAFGLISSHGGLGRQQTDAFLLHPGDMRAPPVERDGGVRHSQFSARPAWRRLSPNRNPCEASTPGRPHLWKGIRDWRTWMLGLCTPHS
jgi:hypothetical protein